MSRENQLNYSSLKPSVFNSEIRSKKARTIVKVCQHFLDLEDLSHLLLLDVGSSSGIIDNFLADYFGKVHGIDIDEQAMQHATNEFNKPNLHFSHGDAMQLDYPDQSIDVVVCSHVYEHVPDAETLFSEIHRVLRPDGFCYFSGNNRVMFMEPHYKLPLLSLLPRFMAHYYMRAMGKGSYYHEKHVGYWSLIRLCSAFERFDYSARIIADPTHFGTDYMLKPGSIKHWLARFIANHVKWATPHIWILKKNSSVLDETNNVDSAG